MVLISAKILTKLMNLLNFKKLVELSLRNPTRTNIPLISRRLYRKFDVNEFQVMDKWVVTIAPKSELSDIHVLFFHGGGYVLEGATMHWKLIQKIATKANCKVSYIDYPLAPEHTYLTTFDMVQQAYNQLIQQYPNNRFMFIGDSAGGGLALAFAQKLVAENAVIQPVKNILFSPWINMNVQHSDFDKFDEILSADALRDAAYKYSGGADLNQYLLSPINGKFEELGETLIFYGTHEMLYQDCLQLRAKTAALKHLHFREFAGMQHDWVLFPIAEADEALEMAVQFIVT